ncbi:hypothetical protein BGZ51_004757 [Haplosporangium sp. Z 767]|nr:hypothetical protein BGZ50_007272 [Haplosporangium sp. Z 11]KAF9182387.1 hypothetical protein BGZ51_004757 [Haplosporangium sp. Z 767]
MKNFSGNPLDAPWTSDFLPNNARVENGHLVLTLKKGQSMNKFGNKPGFGATVSSTRWMLYGKVSARIKSGSPSVGVISSFIYRNAMTGDEVDYEWVGKEPSQIQSNYYWRTPATMDTKDINYGNSIHSEIGVDLSKEFQVYTIEWLPDRLTWSVNDKVVRTMHKSEASNGTQYPSTPSQIQFSIWDGGLGEPDTQEWAGGPTKWEDGSGPYEMYVDWVDIKCHSPVDPVSTPWPPKDQGFQGFINPLERDVLSPLAKEAIVLGTNAPTFSTMDEGGLHWGKFNGRYLVDGKFPIPTNNQRNNGGRNAKFFPFMSTMMVYILACWFFCMSGPF